MILQMAGVELQTWGIKGEEHWARRVLVVNNTVLVYLKEYQFYFENRRKREDSNHGSTMVPLSLHQPT